MGYTQDEPLVRGAGGSAAAWFAPGGDRLVVVRRLLELLDVDAPLTLVSAPAGFGKTTLVRLWIASRGPVAEVIDDVELTDELVSDLLRRVASGTGPRLVVCARPGLAGQVAVDRLSEHAHVIDGHELRLSDDEVIDLWLGLGLSRRVRRLDELAAAVGGWAQLAREVGRALAAEPGRLDAIRVAHEVARELLADRVAEMTERERITLGGLVQPVRLTAASAALAMGLTEDETAPMLEWMAQVGWLGTAALDSGTGYVWPSAAQTALRELLASHSDTGSDRMLADFHLTRGEHDAALEHALLSDDEVVARHVLGRSWLPMLVYRHHDLVAFFAAAPPHWFTDPDDFPHGVKQLALVAPGQTEEWTRRAAYPELPERLPADARTALNHGLVRLFAQRRARQFEGARATARRLCELARESHAREPAEVEELLASIFLLSGLMHGLAGDVTGAVAPLRRAVEMADVSSNIGSERHASAHLAMNLALLGELDEAEGWLAAAAAAPATTGWMSPRARIAVWVTEVLVAVGRGDQAPARVPLRGLLTVRDPLDELWPFVLYARARYARLWGGRQEEVRRLLEAPVAPPGSELDGLLRGALDPQPQR